MEKSGYLTSSTIRLQEQLAEYCRNPDKIIPEGVDHSRVTHYRRLVFNIVKDALSTAYPITKKILSDEEWEQLVFDFFSLHTCKEPQIWKMPFELITFVEEASYDKKLRRPYLMDLLYFEWLEIEVHGMPDVSVPRYEDFSSIHTELPVINPHFKLAAFSYPVHKTAHQFYEKQKGNYFVLVFRKMESGSVRFLDISPFLALIIDKLTNQSISVLDSFLNVAKTHRLSLAFETLEEQAKSFAAMLYNEGWLLGKKV